MFDGWRYEIVSGHARGEISPMVLAPMLAAELAINEALLHFSGHSPFAGNEAPNSISGICRGRQTECRVTSAPELHYLPSRLWLIGLGYLGQAFLWGPGLLPYVADAKVELMLQDVDMITASTESSSALLDSTMLGVKKTRVAAAWTEGQGFAIAITEQTFEETCRRQRDEPSIALCGLGNAVSRRALDQVGFTFVVKARAGSRASGFSQHADLHAVRRIAGECALEG